MAIQRIKSGAYWVTYNQDKKRLECYKNEINGDTWELKTISPKGVESFWEDLKVEFNFNGADLSKDVIVRLAKKNKCEIEQCYLEPIW